MEADIVHTRENINFRPNVDSATKCEEIKSWVLRNNISFLEIYILHTLNKIGVEDLPLSAKTLMSTNRKEIQISNISGEELTYLGSQKYFQSVPFHYLEDREEVLIDIGIDGLKLLNISNGVLCPF